MILATTVAVDIVLMALTALPLLAFSIGWLVRLEMKLKTLDKDHASCSLKRELNEGSSQKELTALGLTLKEIQTDIRWIMNATKNGATHDHEE